MNIFERNVKGLEEILTTKTVAIAGCGGIGSNAAVSLTRAGIGKLIISDYDQVEESNLNRQYFFQSDIGQNKTDALKKHLLNINPQINVIIHTIKLSPDNIADIFREADILIEAFDLAENKEWLIESWVSRFPQKPVISGNGLAGFGNFSSLKIVQSGNIYLCGDGQSDMSMGLCSARVSVVSNMQANLAIELLCTPIN
jgi:sulfur carrier protein ThiS adenylyltransferase